MKILSILVPLSFFAGLAVLTGCAGQSSAYASTVSLLPVDGDTQAYDVTIVIEDRSDGDRPSVISAPRLRLVAGEPATMNITDAEEGIACTAVVDQAATPPEVRTTVTITKDGRPVWSEERTTALQQP